MDFFVRFGFLGCPLFLHQGEGGALKRWGIYHLDRILDIHHDSHLLRALFCCFRTCCFLGKFVLGCFLCFCVADWSGGGGAGEIDGMDDCMVYIQIVL